MDNDPPWMIKIKGRYDIIKVPRNSFFKAIKIVVKANKNPCRQVHSREYSHDQK